MARPGVVVVCAALAGCAKGGAEIIVQTQGVPADRVVLFTGVGDQHTDPIAPAMYSRPIAPNNWWRRDANNVLDQAQVVGGHDVRFAFEPGADDSIAIVVAVGFQKDAPIGMAVAAPIVLGNDFVARYVMPLQPFGDPTRPDPALPLRLQLWQSPKSTDPADTCVHVEDAHLQKTAMIISDPDDPDCDGLPTGDPLECAPKVFMAKGVATLDKLSCALQEPVMISNGTLETCVLGGSACSDGSGFQGGCAHSQYCVPESLCEACQFGYDCIINPASLTTATAYPRIECIASYDASGQLCNNAMMTFRPPFSYGQAMCTGKLHILKPGGGFVDDQITITMTAGSQMQIAVTNLQPTCAFEVKMSGNWPDTAEPKIGLVALADLDNGRGIAIPIVLTRDTQASTCSMSMCQSNSPATIPEGVAECASAHP